MMSHRPILLAAGFATIFSIAGSAVAASSNANAASKGYPNGRPWQAVKTDFIAVKQALADLALGMDGLSGNVAGLQADIALLRDDLAAMNGALSADLQVQVGIMSDATRDADNDAPVTLFVHVTQNGQPVTGLTADQFSYTNAFPAAGASYCGAGCFTPGDGGIYAVTLNGDWSVTTYAGSLAVSNTVMTPDGDVTAHGSSLVTFDIPAAPAP